MINIVSVISHDLPQGGRTLPGAGVVVPGGLEWRAALAQLDAASADGEHAAPEAMLSPADDAALVPPDVEGAADPIESEPAVCDQALPADPMPEEGPIATALIAIETDALPVEVAPKENDNSPSVTKPQEPLPGGGDPLVVLPSNAADMPATGVRARAIAETAQSQGDVSARVSTPAAAEPGRPAVDSQQVGGRPDNPSMPREGRDRTAVEVPGPAGHPVATRRDTATEAPPSNHVRSDTPLPHAGGGSTFGPPFTTVPARAIEARFHDPATRAAPSAASKSDIPAALPPRDAFRLPGVEVRQAMWLVQSSTGDMQTARAPSEPVPPVIVYGGELGTQAPPHQPSQPGPQAAPIDPRPVLHTLTQTIVRADGNTVEVALSPEELGRVRISMASTEAGMVVTLFAEREDTMHLLRRHAAELAVALRHAGIADAQIDFGGSGSGSRDRGSSENTPDLAAGDIPVFPGIGPSADPKPGAVQAQRGLDIRF